eukprot:4532612-Pyramimonas_sp.AAC.1
MQCDAGWTRVGLITGLVTGILFERLIEMKKTRSFAQAGKGLSKHKKPLYSVTSRGPSSRNGIFPNHPVVLGPRFEETAPR